MAEEHAHIDDAFFRKLMADPEKAGVFLVESMTPQVAAIVTDDPPKLLPGSFVAEELRKGQSDLLFQLRTKKGKDLFLYMLFDHKIPPDPLLELYLLSNIGRAISALSAQDQNEEALLPAVIAMVVQHRTSGWTVSVKSTDLFDAPESWRPYLPSLQYTLVGIPRSDD